ncbi:flagellar basal-body MS-ring/collar protein FliF [Plastorhodobacter daqingensis]|uniref:Flagellar M-ring protein n=1 Tax=Plastorhodobacter daqingensis TaxID=1387281 RepID=A0ABW2UNK9_9RHOB
MAQGTNLTTSGPTQGLGALVPQGRALVSRLGVFTAQPGVRRALPAILAVTVAVVALALYALLREPPRQPLFTGLPEAEKARVVQSLGAAGIPVTLDRATGEVLVARDDFHRARMTLAAQGLPVSAPDAYSGLADMPMGTSRSVEMIRIRQAQELDLARSIAEIENVQAARVHLALPERSVFVRDMQPPTASVFVQIAPGRLLEESQVAAIVNLVSASVPNMTRGDVAVVDQTGRLLSRASDDAGSLLNDQQLQYRMRLEQLYRSRIEALVTPIVGPGNLSVQVNVDVDFTRSEVMEERVDPNGNALRSEQNTLDETTDPRARGIPGAVSNTPPAEAELTETPPSPQSGEAEAEPGAEGTEPAPDRSIRSRSTSEVRNYEVSRTVETTQAPAARIARIDAALLLRGAMGTDPETGAPVAQPLPPEVIADIEQLVRSAIGLNDTRGDSLTVSSRPFIDSFDGIAPHWSEAPWLRETARNALLVLLLVAVVMGVIRPLLNRLLDPVAPAQPQILDDDAEPEQVVVGEGETLEDIKARLRPRKSQISMELLDTANSYDDKVALIRMIVADEAGRVSNVFKMMMKDDIDMVG